MDTTPNQPLTSAYYVEFMSGQVLVVGHPRTMYRIVLSVLLPFAACVFSTLGRWAVILLTSL